jgi:hypothetical protein
MTFVLSLDRCPTAAGVSMTNRRSRNLESADSSWPLTAIFSSACVHFILVNCSVHHNSTYIADDFSMQSWTCPSLSHAYIPRVVNFGASRSSWSFCSTLIPFFKRSIRILRAIVFFFAFFGPFFLEGELWRSCDVEAVLYHCSWCFS